jgi:hypothetical protein
MIISKEEDLLLYTLINNLPNKFKRNLRIMNYNIRINLFRVHYYFSNSNICISIVPNDCILFPNEHKYKYKYEVKLIFLQNEFPLNKSLFIRELNDYKTLYYKNSFELINDILYLENKFKRIKIILKRFIKKILIIIKSKKIINEFICKYKNKFFYKPPDKYNKNGGLYYKKALISFSDALCNSYYIIKNIV